MTLAKSKPAAAADSKSSPAARRRTYKEKLELESLPAKIAKLDAQITMLHEEMARPDFYQQPSTTIVQKSATLKDFDQQLAAAYARWEVLEQLSE